MKKSLFPGIDHRGTLHRRLQVHPGVSLGARAVAAIEVLTLAGGFHVEVGGGDIIPPTCEIREAPKWPDEKYGRVLVCRAAEDHHEAVLAAYQGWKYRPQDQQ